MSKRSDDSDIQRSYERIFAAPNERERVVRIHTAANDDKPHVREWARKRFRFTLEQTGFKGEGVSDGS
jgi:hypothetical protein